MPKNCFQDYNLNNEKNKQDRYKKYILFIMIIKLDFYTIREDNKNTAKYNLLMVLNENHAAPILTCGPCAMGSESDRSIIKVSKTDNILKSENWFSRKMS